MLKAEPISESKIEKSVGGKGKKDSHKTSVNLILEGKSLKEVAKERDIKIQTVISHLARYIQESEDPKTELIKFKKLKPSTKQIKDLKSVLAKNKNLDLESRYLLKELQQKAKSSGMNLSYEELALTLIWL